MNSLIKYNILKSQYKKPPFIEALKLIFEIEELDKSTFNNFIQEEQENLPIFSYVKTAHILNSESNRLYLIKY